ncbi:MAG: LLM class F420-dependent oxidoreductase [Chloroflexota bacterium]|nr:LLM class F420-dependent oxidoreductase [Chloroflexota bacterium]
MKFGFYLPNNGPNARPEPLAAIAMKGDALGFECMVANDHILVPEQINSPFPYTVGGEFPGGGTGEYFEQLTLLTYLAGITKQIRLITSVMIVPHRPPLLTAKILSTIDVLSRGRLTVGVGVGWMEEEFRALGAPPFSERGVVTNEYIRAFIELWTSDNPTFSGEYCGFSDLVFLPKPVQDPHPPIWVGGHSRAALRRAATLGNGWHPVGALPASPLEPDDLSEKISLLNRYADEAGRDPETLDISMKALLYDSTSSPDGPRRRFSGSTEEILQDVQTYAHYGVTHLIFDIRGSDLNSALEKLQWFAEDIMAHA